MADIKRRRFGRTEFGVTELSLGAMNLRLLDSLEEAREILNYVLDEGVNLIDTARAYNGTNGRGERVESEVLVGEAIAGRGDLSEPLLVVTKGHGYTPGDLNEELGTSRAKLGIEGRGELRMGENRIHLLYLFHGLNADRWKTIQESGALDRVRELKDEGLIDFIGFSSHYSHRGPIREGIESGVFDAIELPYNVYNRDLGEDGEVDLLAHAKHHDLGVINMKAFGGNGMQSIHNTLEDVTRIDHRAMLNFCLSNPNISTVDAGAKYVREFELDIRTALGPRLSPDELSALKEEADRVSEHTKNICRECMHCLEKFSCPQGIDFPGILALYSRYVVATGLNRDTPDFSEAYHAFEPSAADCTACEECIPWCEYDLNIPEMMREADKTLGPGLPG